MTSILVTYGTGQGQTAKVAAALTDVLDDEGFDVTTCHVMDAADVDVDEFDAVLVGASINNGEHQPSVRKFVAKHADALAARPSGFFQVSLASVFESGWVGRLFEDGAGEYVENLTAETGWEPDRVGLFAGALKYTQYDRSMRWTFRAAAFVFRLGTDTSRDYEYTDWADVDRFGREFAAFVREEQRSTVDRVRRRLPGGTSLRAAALSAIALGVAAGLYVASRSRRNQRVAMSGPERSRDEGDESGVHVERGELVSADDVDVDVDAVESVDAGSADSTAPARDGDDE
jgi:menaquinone-dependent protoporphyrinogen oxidase